MLSVYRGGEGGKVGAGAAPDVEDPVTGLDLECSQQVALVGAGGVGRGDAVEIPRRCGAGDCSVGHVHDRSTVL